MPALTPPSFSNKERTVAHFDLPLSLPASPPFLNSQYLKVLFPTSRVRVYFLVFLLSFSVLPDSASLCSYLLSLFKPQFINSTYFPYLLLYSFPLFLQNIFQTASMLVYFLTSHKSEKSFLLASIVGYNILGLMISSMI